MAERVYKVGLPDGTYRLILARSRRQASNFVADDLFRVWIATKDELHDADCDGINIEEASGQELIESSESPAN